MTEKKKQGEPGKLYGVGVGPGDPELVTLKAVRIIRECDVLIVPGEDARETMAYQIAVQAVPEVADKELLGVYMPMTKDAAELKKSHEKAADTIRRVLESGRDAAFLTLGDPCIYSTYSYLQKRMKEGGFETGIINGIPSFLAVSARLDDVLTEGADMLHIIPATYQIEEGMDLPGTKILMKCGKKLAAVKAGIGSREELSGKMVERCGMEGEKVYQNVQEFPDESGYYSLVIVKEQQI